MNQSVLKKLKIWRQQKADLEKCELYRVFQNKTIEDISMLLPKNKKELLAVKGVREKKFEKYGRDILAIIQECSDGGELKTQETHQKEDKIYTVSDYLDVLNSKLSQAGAAIQGEVSSVSFRNGHAYFSIKDKSNASLLNCFMWANNYAMCGIELVEGMEIIIHGVPEIYKPYGKLSFKATVIELVGEGALKKAYDALKNKLEAMGLFSEERKKPIPQFPHKIGLITSRDGAVIGDFSANIGKFGYKIIFMDSRVEGAASIRDLIGAIDYFADTDIDVLVIIRGGGSLESLQAFNNELLVKKVADLKMPVICGIGHDKDIPLLSYAADKAVSTPTAVAQLLNKSWERALDRLSLYENSIINTYANALMDARYNLEDTSSRIKDFYREIFERFDRYEYAIKNLCYTISYALKNNREKLDKMPKTFSYYFKNLIADTSRMIDTYEKFLSQNDPERQLKLGYSIVTLNNRVITSHSQVQKGDILKIKVKDGKIHSKVEETFNNSL